MSPRRAALVLALALLACAAPPGVARAADAKEQFSRGQKLFDSGEYERALETFKEVFASTGSPNARLYAARCLRELSRLPEAYEEMRAALREATKRAEREERYVPTRDAAAAELALLERRVGRVTVTVVEPPPGTVVKINGAQLAPERFGEPVAVAVGSVLVTADAPGRKRAEKSLEVPAGGLQSAALGFGEESVRPAAGGLGSMSVAGLGVGGAGVGVVVLGGILVGLAQSRFDQVKTACGGVKCTDLAFAPAIDEGKAMQDGGNVALFVGGGMALIGVVVTLVGTQIKSTAADPKATRAAPLLRPTASGFALQF